MPELSIQHFYKYHAGETCLIICNGPNLTKTEMTPEFFRKYPSFGCNSIVLWGKFKPTYYCAGDDRVYRLFAGMIEERYKKIYKFIPTPNLDKWQGDNFVRWKCRKGKLWVKGNLEGADSLTKLGITWKCAPHIMMQLAYYMGFTTMLIVGMDHTDDRRDHAWWHDAELKGDDRLSMWERWEPFTKILYERFRARGVDMFNLTPKTKAKALPKRDWRDFNASAKKS